MPAPEYQSVDAAIRAKGLAPRGGFVCRPEDGVPDFPDGRPAGTLVLFGNVGASLWRAFQATPEARDGDAHPLNRWSERLGRALAEDLGAMALFPFGGPRYLPFIAWAKRAVPVDNSPLGMLIHPQYGLWHAYRGAIAFAEAIELPPREALEVPCDSCADKPCLAACPVAAFDGKGYAVDACVAHIAAPAGADCLDRGCRARRACPVGREHLYAPAQAGLHMRAFLTARLEGNSP